MGRRYVRRWGVDVSCALAPALDTPDLVAVAEEIGYRRAWLYDSPGLYPDVWATIALAAERTTAIGLGPAVLVPSLRHPMVNAAAIAQVEALAPGRLAVAIGSGFTGRMVFGQRPMPWSEVRTYVRVLRALLRGEETEWDGGRIRMLHTAQCAPARPIEVPILVGADGPKGLAVAAELGDGVFSAVVPQAVGAGQPTWRALLTFGSVLEDGEDVTSPRARAALAPGLVVGYHAMYERGGAAAVDGFPMGAEWRASIEAVPVGSRHLAVHEGHLVAPNQHDEIVLEAAAPLAAMFTSTGTRDEIAAKLDDAAAAGVTEIAYQPSGPDLRRELEAFMDAARLSPATG
jgi:5,10-methylenetetrahydromethanopterin reductase